MSSSKIYPHTSDKIDIEAMARWPSYETAEVELPKKRIDLWPWTPLWVVIGVLVVIVLSSFLSGNI